MLQITPLERLEEVQEMLRREVRLPKASYRNVALAAYLDAKATLAYGGRLFEVPPVPYKLASLMNELYSVIVNLGNEEDTFENRRALDQVCELAIPLFKQACRPVSGPRRWLWRWSRNPFEVASPHEVAMLLGFFCSCRTKSSVQSIRDLAATPAIWSSTRQMN